MLNTLEKIKVMQAFEDGEFIEAARYGQDAWFKAAAPSWNWFDYDYRIKVEPRSVFLIDYPDAGLSATHFDSRELAVQYAYSGSPVVEFKEVL